MQIALVRHVEKITLMRVVVQFQSDLKDLKSHILRHSNISFQDFKIIAKNFNNNSWKHKIAQLIKAKRPTLNILDKSVSLKLFN